MTYSFPATSSVVAPVLEGPDGSLYVVNAAGGNDCGEILRMTKVGAVISTYSFDCAESGWVPAGQLFGANDGYIYGTTAYGGAFNLGVIYKLDPTLHVETVL